MEQFIQIKYIVGAIVFSILGLGILGFAFVLLDKLTPGDLWQEIYSEKNLPLAIFVSALILAVAQIVSSAIHG
jgi:putative membrane protein